MESKNYSLVEGPFYADDARDIIFKLINSKINFHKLRILSIQERDRNGFVKPSQTRIQELEETKDNILELLKCAKLNGHLVEMTSTIEIKVIDKVGVVNKESINLI